MTNFRIQLNPTTGYPGHPEVFFVAGEQHSGNYSMAVLKATPELVTILREAADGLEALLAKEAKAAAIKARIEAELGAEV